MHPASVLHDPKTFVRFWSKVTLGDGCWEWQASRCKGYGHFRLPERSCWAHRLAYELFNGPIPSGLTLDHLCRNPPCVRPDHLEAVTLSVNVMRGVGAPALNAHKTACLNGHAFDETNTRMWRGHRICRECKRDWGIRGRLAGLRR